MTDFDGSLEPIGRVALVVSKYHGRITRALLDGAKSACAEAGIDSSDVDVCWVDGAFELGVVTASCSASGRYAAVVALGVIIRGETPHFEFVATESAAAIGRSATTTLVPVGFGLLTCDTLEQALARSGGNAGNKGKEAAEAAIRTASLLQRVADSR